MGTIADLLREKLRKIESEIHSALHNQGDDEDKNAKQLHEAVRKIRSLSLEASLSYADYRGWPTAFNAACGGGVDGN